MVYCIIFSRGQQNLLSWTNNYFQISVAKFVFNRPPSWPCKRQPRPTLSICSRTPSYVPSMLEGSPSCPRTWSWQEGSGVKTPIGRLKLETTKISNTCGQSRGVLNWSQFCDATVEINKKQKPSALVVKAPGAPILVIQWGSDYRSSPVFKWSKVVWSPNGLVFQCHLNTDK